MPELLSDVCRLCLSKDGLMLPIFRNQDPSGGIAFPYKMMTCADIEIFADDGLPSKICHRCFHQVEKSYQFRNMCEKSDAILHSQLQVCTTVTKSEDTSDSSKSAGTIHETLGEEWNGVKIGKAMDFVSSGDLEAKVDVSYLSCFACQHICGTMNELVQHLETDHNNIGTYICRACNISFASLMAFSDHFNEKHMDFDSKQCDLCNKVFKYQESLEEHKKSHEKKFYTCKYCSKTFQELFHMKKHEITHIERICKYCSLEFPNKTLCQDHVSTCSQMFNCKFCEQLFSTKKDLMEHVIRCHDSAPIHKCNDCLKVFFKWEDVNEHSCETHNEESFHCKICQITFGGLAELESHMFQHSSSLLKCRFCAKKFSLKSSLKRHEKSHSGLKPYQCKFCPRKFKDNGTCVVHMRTHTGEQPFECQQCHKQFKQLANLKMHTYRHHKKSKASEPPPEYTQHQEDPQLYSGQVLMGDKGMSSVETFPLDTTRVYHVLDITVPGFEHNVHM